MSIETERWEANGRDIVDPGGAVVASAFDDGDALAIAVLPEALALLKRLDRTGGLGLDVHESIQDILRRAGVIT